MASGSDETPPAGTLKEFVVDYYGNVREVKPFIRQSSLTASSASIVDEVYGSEEQAVIENLRTRVGELESKLRSLGFLE